jgi:hypothetical protein
VSLHKPVDKFSKAQKRSVRISSMGNEENAFIASAAMALLATLWPVAM